MLTTLGREQHTNLKILVCSSDFLPTPGGIARLSWCSARALLAAGHEVRVIAAGRSSAAKSFDRQQPLPIRRVSARLGWRELEMWWALQAEIKNFRPDVLWSALWFPPAWLATYCPAPYRPIHIASAYGSEILPNLQAGFKQWVKAQMMPMRRRVFRQLDWFFPLSRYTMDRLVKLGADPARMDIVPGGVDEHWFDIRKRPRPAGAPPMLLTVARLDEHKGHDLVIRALPGLLQQFADLRYVIAGPRPDGWPRLDKLASELGVRSSIDYLGRVSEADLHRLYAEADLFVMPSREIEGKHVEGFGITFLEAAAVGLPSVGGRSGGVPDAIAEGETGLLCDPHSVEELQHAVASLLSQPDRLAAMGERARQRALTQFTWEKVAARMLWRFEQLLSGRAR